MTSKIQITLPGPRAVDTVEVFNRIEGQDKYLKTFEYVQPPPLSFGEVGSKSAPTFYQVNYDNKAYRWFHFLYC